VTCVVIFVGISLCRVNPERVRVPYTFPTGMFGLPHDFFIRYVCNHSHVTCVVIFKSLHVTCVVIFVGISMCRVHPERGRVSLTF